MFDIPVILQKLWGKIILGSKLTSTLSSLNEHINILMIKLCRICFKKRSFWTYL